MSDRPIPHVTSFVLEQPWALTPTMLSVLAAVVARRIAGRPDDGALWGRSELLPARPAAPSSVAVLPLHGVLSPRINLLSEMSGGTSYEQAAADLAALVADPGVGTIVLDLDTPGGSVAGATSLARAILQARATKPVIAQVAYNACSAGYWLAACATEICAAPQSCVGSIGVYSMHENLEEALKQEGVQVTFISAGKYKVEGNATGPLTDEAHAHRQALVDEAYTQFVADVALGRGLSAAQVRSGYGEGRTLSAAMALDLGMVDRIASLDETLTRVTQGDAASAPRVRTIAHAHTSQEPAKATDQDWRAANVRYARETEAALLGLSH